MSILKFLLKFNLLCPGTLLLQDLLILSRQKNFTTETLTVKRWAMNLPGGRSGSVPERERPGSVIDTVAAIETQKDFYPNMYALPAILATLPGRL